MKKALFLALIALVGCSNEHGVTLGKSTERVVKVRPSFAPASARGREIAVKTPGADVRLEVAADKETLQQGLAGRASLPAHSGMLFVSPWPGDHFLAMWMKDTKIPVDMVFISTHGVVTSVAAHVPAPRPHALDYAIARRYGYGHYVIELPAGEAAADYITRGTQLKVQRGG